MTMMVPARRTRNLFNDLMHDPFDSFFDMPSFAPQKATPTLMRTDIKETDEGFELTIDLPGFKKEDVSADLKDGYLKVSAQTAASDEAADEKGTWVRRERFSGKCSRTFFVGDEIVEDEIKARFEDGVLSICVPKKQPEAKADEPKQIAIC